MTDKQEIQRLIGQVVELQGENKRLRNTIETLIDHEISCQHRGVGYDIFVHRESTIALKGE